MIKSLIVLIALSVFVASITLTWGWIYSTGVFYVLCILSSIVSTLLINTTLTKKALLLIPYSVVSILIGYFIRLDYIGL
jgi:hypothetical protein